MAAKNPLDQGSAQSLIVERIQSRLASLDIGEKVEKELNQYFKLTTMKECQQEMLAIGPTPELDETIKTLQATLNSHEAAKSDEEPLDKTFTSTITTRLGLVTPQTSREPSETCNIDDEAQPAGVKHKFIYASDCFPPPVLPVLPDSVRKHTTYVTDMLEVYAPQWSCLHDIENDDNTFICYRKYDVRYADSTSKHASEYRAEVQIFCSVQAGMIYEDIRLDCRWLRNIFHCKEHYCIRVEWKESTSEKLQVLSVYFDNETGDAMYNLLEEDLKDTGCWFARKCNCYDY